MSDDAYGNLSGKRLVIFGCGYVGSELARQALARGAKVTALTRNESKADALRRAGVEVVLADLVSDDWHQRLEGGADFVVNCVSSGGGGLTDYRRNYVQGMASVMRWARGAPSGALVYTSSTSVYPQNAGEQVDETASNIGVPERGQILLETEASVRSKVTGFARWFILRLAGIYGPGRHSLLEQVRTGEVSGRGEHRLNLVHRDDICAAIWAALRAPMSVANGIFNVADDGAAKKSEIAGWLAARLGLPPPRFTGDPLHSRRAALERVIVNTRLKQILDWRPAYPTFREGYENILSRS